MRKNSAKILANLVLSTRSNVFKELCQSAIDENGFQSDESARRLKNEILTDLKDLLSGRNWDAISEKIVRVTVTPILKIRRIGERQRLDSLNTTMTKIRLGAIDAHLLKVLPDESTAEQFVYLHLAQALETGDIQHLMLCQVCGKIFYRKSLKGAFCSDDCRWRHFNSYEERHRRYKRAVEESRGRPTRITSRGPLQKRLVRAK